MGGGDLTMLRRMGRVQLGSHMKRDMAQEAKVKDPGAQHPVNTGHVASERCDQGARTNQPAGVEHHIVELVEEIHQPAGGRELEKGRQEATIPGVKGVTSLPDVDDPEAEEETNEAEVQR